MALHSDQCTDDCFGLRSNRSRLGLLHHGYRLAQVHERCAAILDQGQWIVLLASVSGDVDRFALDGGAERLADLIRQDVDHLRTEAVHHYW